MLKISETTDMTLVKSIQCDNAIFHLTIGNSCNISPEEYTPSDSFKYLVISRNDITILLVSFRHLTNQSVEVHLAVLPQYRKSRVLLKAIRLAMEYLKEKGYAKLMTFCALNCTHILSFCERLGFKPCGVMQNGIVYNNKISDLIYFEFDLNNLNLLFKPKSEVL